MNYKTLMTEMWFTAQASSGSAEGRWELHEPKMASAILTDIQAPSSWFSLTCCFFPLSPGFGWAVPNLESQRLSVGFRFLSHPENLGLLIRNDPSYSEWSIFCKKKSSEWRTQGFSYFPSHPKMMADYSSYIYVISQDPSSEVYWSSLWRSSYNQKKN